MNIKVLGKSLLGIVSTIVLIVSSIVILLGIYIESIQQSGSGYELAFAGLVFLCLSLFGCRKAIRSYRHGHGISDSRSSSHHSDAPVLRANDYDDKDDSDIHESLSEHDEGHVGHDEAKVFAVHEQVTAHSEPEANRNTEYSGPTTWWYADNREEPKLSFTNRIHDESMISTREDDIDIVEPEDEVDDEPLENKHVEREGWFGFNDYEEPEWVDEEESEEDEVMDEQEDSVGDDESAPIKEPSHHEEEAAVIEPAESARPDEADTTKSAPKPRMRVTAGIQDSSKK